VSQTDQPARDADAKPGAGVPAIDAVSHADLEHADPRRWAVFGLTWLSYASYYLTRKNYSIAKARLQDAYGIAPDQLGTIGGAYSAAYAVGQLVWGAAADRFGPRRVLGLGMIATALCSMAFGMSRSFWAFLVIWTLNGLAQATGWSPNVKAMTGWFPERIRGRVMGFWTTNYTIGSFVANPVARQFIKALTWQWALYGPAVPVAFVGLALLLFLPEASRPGQSRPGEKSAPDPAREALAAEEGRAARRRVLTSPFLWALGIAYFFLKLTRYFFWGWAPYYMEKVLGYDGDLAAYVPLAFDVGGMIGAITIGWVSDRFLAGRRMPAAVVSVVCLGAMLMIYGQAAASGVTLNVLALFLCGFFLFGPDAIVSATAAQDLGGPRAAAVAAGVINGIGSVGQIVAEKVNPSEAGGADWSNRFRVIGVLTAISALVLAPFWNRGRRAVS
jgi:sugar phosphate permease